MFEVFNFRTSEVLFTTPREDIAIAYCNSTWGYDYDAIPYTGERHYPKPLPADIVEMLTGYTSYNG